MFLTGCRDCYLAEGSLTRRRKAREEQPLFSLAGFAPLREILLDDLSVEVVEILWSPKNNHINAPLA